MKLLFVHDVKARIHKGKVYARSYGYDIWKERYLTAFEEVLVLTRNAIVDEDLSGKVDCLSGDRVDFDARIGMFKGPESFFSSRIRNIVIEDVKKADYVICRLDSFLGLIAIRECKKLGKPYLIEVAGCAWDSFWNHGLAGKILAIPLYLQMRKAIKDAKYVVYVTKDFLQKRYPTTGENTNISNVKMLRNGREVLIQRIDRIMSRNEEQKLVLGTAANVDVRYKGQQFVIKALAILKKQGKTNYEYQLPGSGNTDYLFKLAKKLGVGDQVVFLGPLTHEKMMKWYRDIDVYIQPSLQEGLPRSVIEAMGFGLPCIGSDVAGIPELLESNVVFARKKNIPKRIANLIGGLDPTEMVRQAELNFKRAKDYDYDALLKKRMDFLSIFKGANND